MQAGGRWFPGLHSQPHLIYTNTDPPPPADPGPGRSAFPSQAIPPLPASTSDPVREKVGQRLVLAEALNQWGGDSAQVPPLSPPAPPHPSLSTIRRLSYPLSLSSSSSAFCNHSARIHPHSPLGGSFPACSVFPSHPHNSEPSPHSSQAQYKCRLPGPHLPQNWSS